MDELAEILSRDRIAYFSMEIALAKEIPTYSGGLGILAGDTIRSSAELNLPLVGVTLVNRNGYFYQELDDNGRQSEKIQNWSPSEHMKLLNAAVTVRVEGRDVKVKGWLYVHRSFTGGMIPVIFLDTDDEDNSPQDRQITHYLYGGDEKYRLMQEIVLGTGGVRLLEELGFSIIKYHMNEGHSSLMTLELLHRYRGDEDKVRRICIFTTHTPVASGHDTFSFEMVEKVMGDGDVMELLHKFGESGGRLNMTVLALNLSDHVNGVAKRHREVSEKMFPGYKFNSITNGVHSYTWVCPQFRELYDRYIPGWANEPELLVRVRNVPNDEIWRAHMEAKRVLIDHVNREKGIGFSHDALTIGFGRRMAEYKRPAFVFSDLERLRKVNEKGNIQFIFAGKAHPRDERGKAIIQEIFGYMKELRDTVKIAFLENYDMELALKMTSGVDLWLNTPKQSFEASGTSGMKASHNGVVNFSVLDGWWIEGCVPGVTGYAIGPAPGTDSSREETESMELDDLYYKLEYVIIPEYYDRRDEWINVMKNSIGMIAYYFNTHRMMRRYVTETYL
jgi:starch phosphorylase